MTLRTKTALLLALSVALGIVVSGFVSLSFFKQSLRRSILQGAESLAQSTAQTIDQYLAEARRDAEAIAAQLPAELLQPENLAALDIYLQQSAKQHSHFENGLFVLSPQGDLLADYPAHPEVRGKNFAFRQYFQAVLKKQGPIIGQPYISSRTGMPVLTFSVPLRGRHQELCGVLNCSVQLTSPRALGGLTQRRFGQTGYIYVYDSTRLMILHPDRARINRRDVPVGANLLFDKALQGLEGSGETVNSRGVAMLAAFTQSKEKDWVVAAQQPAAEAFAPLRQAQFKVLWVLLASAALAATLGLLAIRQVTLPLTVLRDAARRLNFDDAEGAATGEIEPGRILQELEGKHGGDEIGGLARTLREQHQELGKSLSALRDAAENWEQTFNSVRDAIFVVDQDCCIQRLNRAARELFRITEEQAIGTPCFRLVHGGDRPPDNCPGRLTLASGRPEQRELTETLLPGVFEETTTLLLKGGDGQLATVHLLKDLTQAKETEAQIKRLAFYDSLTGLPNRSLFTERFGAVLQTRREGDRLAAVLFVDLDQFKVVNDTLGHSAGDQLLKVVARRLEGCLRQTDMVARFGGDEFVIGLSRLGEEGHAAEIADKLLKVLTQPMELGGKLIAGSASIGIALFPRDGEDLETLLKHADAAMYQAKALGRNGFQFFSEEMERRVLESLARAETGGGEPTD